MRSRKQRTYLLVVLGVGFAVGHGPGRLAAQGQEAASITAPAIERTVQALRADSVGPRITPSPGLEVAARYVAGQFAQLGLEPASALMSAAPLFGRGVSIVRPEKGLGDSMHLAGWFQRYPVPLPVDLTQSAVVFTVDSQRATAPFATAARFAAEPFFGVGLSPRPAVGTGVILVAGHLRREQMALVSASLRQAGLDGKIVLYVASHHWEDLDVRRQWNNLAAQLDKVGHPAGGVILTDDDVASFTRRAQVQRAQVVHRVPNDRWNVWVQPDAAPGLVALLRAAGVELAQLRTDATPVVRELPALRIALDAHADTMFADTATAPNVIGVVPGSDSILKHQYVVFTARMDTPRSATRGDTLREPDNAAGVAALLALAHAFQQTNVRPRRTLLFVATSGDAQPGFWGSGAFAEGVTGMSASFDPAPLIPVVFNVNLELGGMSGGDSLVVDGLHSVETMIPLDQLAAGMPAPGVHVVDGGSAFEPRGGQVALAANPALGVPGLNFWTVGAPAGTAVDAERVARLTRLVFEFGLMVANADQPPRWSAQGRQEMTEAAAP